MAGASQNAESFHGPKTETISVTCIRLSPHERFNQPYPDYAFNYDSGRRVPEGVEVTVDLDKPVPAWMEGKIGFNLEIVPHLCWDSRGSDGNTEFSRINQVLAMTQGPIQAFGELQPFRQGDLDQLLLDGKRQSMIADDIVSAPMAGKHFLNHDHPKRYPLSR